MRGVQKLEGGVAENGGFRQGASLPLGDLSVTSNRDSSLATQRSRPLSDCKLAVTEHPDVILIDLEMPVMDRWEPVRTLKKDPRTQKIPIIGMSAYADASGAE